MNTPHTGGLLGRRFKRLRRHRTLTLAPALADAAVAAAAAAAAPTPSAIAAAAAPAREGGGEEEVDARRGGGDEGPAQAAANDDGARGGAVAAPGRPFDSDKARGAESGRSRPRSKPNATSMNLTLRGCHATELCRTRPGSLHGARYNAIEEARSLRF